MTDSLKKAFRLYYKEGAKVWDAAKSLDFCEFGIFLSKILDKKWRELKKRLGYSSEIGCFHCGFEIEDAADFFNLYGFILHRKCVIAYLNDGNWEKLLNEEGEKRFIARAMAIIWEPNAKYLGNNVEIRCLKRVNLFFI